MRRLFPVYYANDLRHGLSNGDQAPRVPCRTGGASTIDAIIVLMWGRVGSTGGVFAGLQVEAPSTS